MAGRHADGGGHMLGKAMSALLSDVSYRSLGDEDVVATGIAFRSDSVEDGDVFFCVRGLKSDGHSFAADAVDRGCSALVVDHKLLLDVPQYIVGDCRLALAYASARFFDLPSKDMDVVGVTGTNGKTTTTYLVDWASKGLGRKTGIIGMVETKIGQRKLHADHTTPESFTLESLLAEMRDAGCETVAMEVSSHAIDLDRVIGVEFSVVAFSNLTQDHLDYHHDMESYFEAKAKLFSKSYSKHAAICIDDDYGKRLADIASDAGLDVVTTGFSPDAMISPLHVDYRATHTALTISMLGQEESLDYPLIGRFNVENILLALGICKQLGYPLDEVCKLMAAAPQAPGRLERVEATQGATVKADTGFSVYVDYAHTPDSIEKAISALRPITESRLIIVFGCGGDRDRTKRPLMGKAACSADHMVVTSDNPRSESPAAIIADILEGMTSSKDRYDVEPDRRLAIRRAMELARPGDCILIAGKGHEDYQLVGDKVLSFDDRVVAREELDRIAANGER